MPIQLDRFVPSKKNYAIKWDTLRELRQDLYVVDALWAFKKKGEMFISSGLLSLYDLRIGENEMTVEHFMEYFDGRHGGSAECTWDGTYMTTQSPLPLSQMIELSEQLDPILNKLPDIPQNHEGWYRLSSR